LISLALILESGIFSPNKEVSMKKLSLNLVGLALVALTILLLAGCPQAAVTPAPATVVSMSCVSPPTKTVYSLGETLDLGGIKLDGVWSDGSSAGVAVSAADVSGFDSSKLVQDQVLTVKKDAGTATFTVHIIGDLVGSWYNPSDSLAMKLSADMSGDVDWTKGGTWSVSGNYLTITYSEYNDKTTGWTTLAKPDLHRWSYVIIAGKLYLCEAFTRVGTGAGIIGDWERIAGWDGSYGKDLCTVTSTATGGQAVMKRAPLTSDIAVVKATGVGTWDMSSPPTVLTLNFDCGALTPAAGRLDTITVTSSSNTGILDLGPRNWVWVTPDLVGIDATGWVRK
jgi:hypothetical protein